jgi:gliding motility-associated-like protein
MIKSVRIFLIFLILGSSFRSFSQLPSCPNGLVYFHTSPIQVYNPALPISATNPSNTGIPLGGTGLSVGPNIFAATPATTFFTTIGGFFAYWNGTAWVTTSVSTSNGAAVNIGSGPGCIYNLVGGTGQVYVSNGTGPATLLTTITGFSGGGPYDLVVDNCCNFYVLKTTSPQSMTMYGPGGNQLCTYNMTGMGNISAGGGFAIVGNQVIVSNTGGLYVGNITGTTVSFTNVSTNSYGAGDFANCPLPCGPLTANAVNTASSSPIGCGGGTANVIVTSTTSPLSYTWSGPGIVSGVNSATAVINQCGVYTATVTKAGCPPATTVITTNVPCVTTFTPTLSISNPLSCTQPSAVITASPGPAGYTYTWTGPGIVGSPNVNPITANVGGVYTASVINTVTGCKGTVSINLPANFTTPPLTVTPTPTSVCLGSSVNLNVTGANTYTWSPGATLNTTNGPNVVATPVVNTTYTVRGTVGVCTVQATAIVNINPQPTGALTPSNASCGLNNGQIVISNTSGPGQTVTGFSVNGVGVGTQTVINLAAGNYTVSMVNNFGCVTNYVTSITNSPPITALATTTFAPKCGVNNGSISIGAVTGGTPTYSYNINGGPYSTSPPLTNLAPGTYTIGVIDSKGCTFVKTVILTNVPGPTALNFTTTPSSCSGGAGTATIGVTGGTAAYSYSINGVASGSTAVGLGAGTYSVIVRDANGCLINSTFVIGTLSGPSSANVVVTNATCGNANGSATVTSVTGGTAPYQYSWNGGPFAATNNVSGLAAGTYTVIIRDVNTCTISVVYNIVNSGSPVASIASSGSVTCNGASTGSITVNVVGGTPGYNYTLTPTGATNGIGIFTGLTAQAYTITVKDAVGCLTSVTVNIPQPPALTLNLTPAAVSCNAGTNGSITAVAGGGTTPYQYSLNGGPFGGSANFTGLTAGVYSVTVMDNNGCTRTTTTTITQPAPLAISFTTAPTTCIGSVGAATLGVTGGTPVYSYSVNGVGTSSVATGLASGSYTATVRDNNGCILTGNFNITMVAGPTAANVITGNATCGNANGSATVSSVTGGVAPYQYSFNGGPFSLSNNTAGLTAGTHTVVVRDNNNCTYTVSFNINNTGSPVSTISASVNVACFGGNTGSFSVSTTGGTPGYSYTLSPTGTTNTSGIFTVLTAQNYNVTVADAVGCVTSVTINITQPTPLTLTLTPTAVSCNAGANGSITAAGGGGTPGYQYSLNGGPFGGSGSFTGLTAGTYTVTIRDNNNCTFNQTTIITQPTALTLNTAVTPNSCAGSVGSVTITGSGGTPAYSFSIDAVTSANTATGLTSGTHTATIMDNNGCVQTATFNIGNITGPVTATVNTTNANCGNANGSATLTGVTGGVGPYQYSWNGGPFSSNAFVSGLLAGTHTLTVLDANTCTLTITYNVGNTGSPVSTIGAVSNVSCFGGANGSFTINTAGGTPGYSYTLTPTNATSGSGVFAGLAAGAYSALVKDAAGCVTTVTVNITEPTALTLTLSSLPTLCNGSTNGSITAVGSGGTGPYQYNLNGGPFQASGNFTGVGAAIYNVTVQDNNGCTLTQSVQVNQPSVITLTFTTSAANCTSANGTASVTASGGTPFYNYSWTGGGGTSAQTNPLAAGVYSVTVTDANGCTRTASVTIGITPGGTAVISASTHVSCFGGNNGSLTAGFTGPMNAPITYSWSNGQTTQTATGLIAGTYSVILTDAFGCTSTVSGTIMEPSPLDVSSAFTNVTCFGGNNGTGSAIYNSGGTPPITYLWAPGGATTATAPNLTAGIYSVTVTDSKGCFVVATVTITQPTSVTVTSSVTTANCNQSNGSATVSATGGTGPYTYTWSTTQTGPVLTGAAAGTYTINVQDANGCLFTSAATVPNAAGPVLAITGSTNVSCFGGNNGVATTSVSGGTGPYIYLWSNGQNTGTGTNFPAGIHTATVTDQNGCSASVSVTITQPPALVLNVTGTDPLCFNATNGTANAGVLGGTPGYNYNWVPSSSTAQSPVGLGPGVHLVTVTDANGCVINGSVTLNNPVQMTASITSTNVTCFGACNGMANGSAANTVGAVVYFWTGGPGPLSTQNVTNLCPGSYTLLATDQNSCTAQALTTITEPPLLTASITASGNPSCATYTNGFATVTPAGGTPGYTYAWSPSGGTGPTENNLGAGNYVATVTDSKGCTATANITLTQPTPLMATIASTNVTCFGANNGISNITYSGGTGPYNFLWLPTLNNTPNVNTLPPGTHTIQVTDNLGCVTTLTTAITEPPALTAAVTASNSNCNQANGNACVLAGGGAGGYSYQWTSNPMFTNSCINNVVAGAYTVTVTDVNGCTITAIANINDIAGPSISITATTAVSCFGGNNGSATTNISGGTGTISALWSYLAQTTQNVNNLPAGLHSITIMDAAGCVASASVQITEPTQLVSAITSVSMVTCNGSNNGSATMLVNGGTPGYNYIWTPSAQTSSVAVSMSPGTYTCAVTDANGCPTSQTVTITQPNPLTITSSSVTNLSCNGNNTGQVNTTISGGSPAYTLVWTPAQPGNPVITNLAAGTYSLLVTDTKSCTTTGVYVVTEPSALASSATATPATCGNANGSATVTVSGGTPGYTYNWNTPAIQTTPIATGMSPNTWSCTITDSKGCIITQSVNVPNAPGPVLSSMSFTAPLCFGQQNGSMAINTTSGTLPFSYIWNNPSASTTQTVNGVGAGVYSATVTDAYGCTTNGVVNVTQPNILVLNVSADPTICYGELTQIYAAGAGGTPAYSYTWNPSTLTGGGPHTQTPTVTTQYVVSMSDANGCSVNPKTITINVRPQLLATGYALTKCHGDAANLNPTITSPGNGGPYTYNWTGGSTASAIQVTANYPTNPNTYTVNINDGCTNPGATAVFTVNVNPLPSGSFSADVLKGCAPLNVVFTAQSNGGSGDTYAWNITGGQGSSENGSPKAWAFPDAGMYSVTLVITNNTTGCHKDTVAANYIEVYPVPTAEFTADPWEASILNPDIQFTNLSVGASSYFWDFGDFASSLNNSTDVNPMHSYETANVYQVWLVAFNDKGCKDTIMHTVKILSEYALYIPNTFTPDGNGLNDIFQPKGVGIDESSYKMYIFDRWGEIVFTSDEFRKGWDGSVKNSGKQAEQGVYTYKILVKDVEGNVHQYIGHVNCLPRQNKVD